MSAGKYGLRRDDLLYPELSYKIIGTLYAVYNDLGYGHDEAVYQRAVAVSLRSAGLYFQEQLYAPVFFREQRVGKNYFDFLIEKAIVLELKRGDRFAKTHIEQVYRYLIAEKLKLGILAYFAHGIFISRESCIHNNTFVYSY